MFSKKGLSEYVSLCLISSKDYEYSSIDIKEHLQNEFEIRPEVIFPMLRGLVDNDLVEFIWSDSKNAPRKLYKILPKGMDLINKHKPILDMVYDLSEKVKRKSNESMN